MTFLLDLPATRATDGAFALCARYASPALLGHSVRSFVWARDHAVRHGLDHDAELLLVAALFHDLSLTPVFDAHVVPFEVAAGELGRVFVTGAGWSLERADRVAVVMVTHLRDDVAPAVDVESHLLQVGTTADVFGGGAGDLSPLVVAETLAAYPRDGFAPELVASFRAEAARKPGCATAALVAGGIEARILANPLDRSRPD